MHNHPRGLNRSCVPRQDYPHVPTLPGTFMEDQMAYHAPVARASQLKDGVRVEYRGSWGRNYPVSGTIVGEPTIESNDQLTWCVRLDAGEHRDRWGYVDQFSLLPCETDIIAPNARPWSKTVCDYVGECADGTAR